MAFFPSTAEIEKEFQRYCELYALAEKVCKGTEYINLEGVLIPAIKQLCYAGHHIVRAHLSDDAQVTLKEIQSGQKHAGRAIHDAYDAVAIYYAEQCKQFIAEFKSITITEVYPDFLTDRRALEDAKRAIIATARTSTIENDAAVKEKHVDTLKAVYDNFENARDELNKLKIKERRRAMITAVFLLLGAIGTIIALLK